MRIYNYNFARAEAHLRENDLKVAKTRRRTKYLRLTQLITLLVMLVGLIAMAVCSIIVLTVYKEEQYALMFGSMMSATTCCFAVLIFSLMSHTYRKLKQKSYDIEDVEYDDVETRYHRLVKTYEKVEPCVKDNVIICLCYDKDNCLCGYEFRPRLVCKATKNKVPVFDLATNCLWMP